MRVACVLRSGGDFRPAHVQWLARQVPGLVCLSDVPVPGVETIPLKHGWPGWFSKLEMFGPSLRGDVLMMDLDTVVLNLPDEPGETTVLQDFTHADVMGSGLMFVTAADRRRVWDAWMTDPAGHMAACSRWPKYGDQGFLQDHIGNAAKWGDRVRSYKVHCTEALPEGTDVVCFHGQPRPWAVRAPWVPRFTAPPALGTFQELILKHPGARICVMGGAPGLAEQLEQVEADVFISTNAHGADLVEADYLLAMDERHSRHGDADMGDWMRSKSGAPIVSPHGYADYRLGMWPQNPRFVLSGMIATWAAFAMGAGVVILAGCDGYGGDEGYIDEARKIARDVHCPVRVVGGGPLSKVWPAYDPKERFMEYTPHSSIDGLLGIDGRIRVRARKACTVDRVNLLPGQEMTAMRHEVARLLKHRMVEEVDMPKAEAPAPAAAEPAAALEAAKRRGGRPRKAA